jgi:hypothetical protein
MLLVTLWRIFDTGFDDDFVFFLHLPYFSIIAECKQFILKAGAHHST